MATTSRVADVAGVGVVIADQVVFAQPENHACVF
jgi:hypothetical protein